MKMAKPVEDCTMDSFSNSFCAGDQCQRCGFNKKVMESRVKLLEEKGLTEIKPGIHALVLGGADDAD